MLLGWVFLLTIKKKIHIITLGYCYESNCYGYFKALNNYVENWYQFTLWGLLRPGQCQPVLGAPLYPREKLESRSGSEGCLGGVEV